MADAHFTSYLGEVQKGLEAQATKALKVIGDKAATYAMLNSPVKTGTLKRSMSAQMVSPLTVEVGSNVEYAPDVELGNGKPRKAGRIPFLRPAIEEHTDEYKRMLESFLGK